MTAEQAPDPAAALAAARRPLEPRSMPPADFAVRMRTSVVLRRLVPTRLAVRRAAKKGAALWDRSPEERDRARTTLEVIITGTARANELETLAQTYLVEGAIQAVLFWQPWRTTRSDEQSLAHSVEPCRVTEESCSATVTWGPTTPPRRSSPRFVLLPIGWWIRGSSRSPPQTTGDGAS
jgi:hypothetical protein